MLSSGIIDLAIGLAFIFGATAAISSVITEMIARFLGLRGAYLLLGLRELLDSKGTSIDLSSAVDDFKNAQKIMSGERDVSKPPSATGAILGSPILRSQGMTGKIFTRDLKLSGVTAGTQPSGTQAAASAGAASAGAAGSTRPDDPMATADSLSTKESNKKAPLPRSGGNFLRTWSMRRSLPSYISSRSFAEAVIDLVIPDRSGRTTMSDIQGRIQAMVAEMPDHLGTLGTSLESLAANAGGDIDRFRTMVEQWYDDHMDRVSGWYKRRTALITFIAGGILVLLLNVNAITIGRALYTDSATRTAVSTAAASGNPCPASSSPSQQDCLAKLEKQVSAVAQAGLPLGWGIVPACTTGNVKCGLLEQHGITTPGNGSWWQVFLAVLGFLITIAALAPGAQFWFGLVVKLNSLRSTGPPPATSGTSGASAR